MILRWLVPGLVLCWAFGSPLRAESGPLLLPSKKTVDAAAPGLAGAAGPRALAVNARMDDKPGLGVFQPGCAFSTARRVVAVFLGFPESAPRGEACDTGVDEAGQAEEGAAAAEGPQRPIEIYENPLVRRYLNNYLETNRRAFEKGLERSEQYLGMIRAIFAEQGLPLELAYLAAVESNFNYRARSQASATGLWQFMYHTARKFGLRIRYPWYDERLDPERSTRAAGRLLSYLHDRYGSWELALAAYNAGEGRVNQALRQARRRGRATDYWKLELPEQTQEYVPAFMAVAMLYASKREGLELARPVSPPPRVTDTLEVDFSISLAEVAHRLGVPLPEMVRLNPGWRRGYLPPGLKGGATLRLPLGMKNTLLASLQHEPDTPIPWLTHTVEVGETLARIARGYGLTIAEILSVNPIPNRHFLAIGQRLIIPLPPAGPRASAAGAPHPPAAGPARKGTPALVAGT